MALTHDRPEGYFFIRTCDARSVTIIDRSLRNSCLVLPDRVVEDWPVDDIGAFTDAVAQELAALKPELILLGTGASLRFPSVSSRSVLLRQHIGIEVMDNGAACRTYNLLAEEGRYPLLALILPSSDSELETPDA
ncbi:MAG: MTH938/NDUFAF3 family protein [Dokdonella sp.]